MDGGYEMQSILFGGGFIVLACWVIVILHRLGNDTFNPARYSIMAATLPIAYMIVAISVCGLVGGIIILLIRK